MKKEFSSKYNKKTYRSNRVKWLAIVFIAMVLLLTSAFIIYKHKKPRILASQIATLESWFIEHKKHLQKKLVKVKQVVTNQADSKPEIHFEFYTTLPNMQIKAQEMHADIDKDTKIKINKIKIFDAEKIQDDLESVIQKSEK